MDVNEIKAKLEPFRLKAVEFITSEQDKPVYKRKPFFAGVAVFVLFLLLLGGGETSLEDIRAERGIRCDSTCSHYFDLSAQTGNMTFDGFRFTNVDFGDSNFFIADLQNAVFTNIKFDGAVLSEVSWRNTSISDSQILDTTINVPTAFGNPLTISRSDLEDVRFFVTGRFTPEDFFSAMVKGNRLEDVEIIGMEDLEECEIDDADFSELSSSDFILLCNGEDLADEIDEEVEEADAVEAEVVAEAEEAVEAEVVIAEEPPTPEVDPVVAAIIENKGCTGCELKDVVLKLEDGQYEFKDSNWVGEVSIVGASRLSFTRINAVNLVVSVERRISIETDGLSVDNLKLQGGNDVSGLADVDFDFIDTSVAGTVTLERVETDVPKLLAEVNADGFELLSVEFEEGGSGRFDRNAIRPIGLESDLKRNAKDAYRVVNGKKIYESVSDSAIAPILDMPAVKDALADYAADDNHRRLDRIMSADEGNQVDNCSVSQTREVRVVPILGEWSSSYSCLKAYDIMLGLLEKRAEAVEIVESALGEYQAEYTESMREPFTELFVASLIKLSENAELKEWLSNSSAEVARLTKAMSDLGDAEFLDQQLERVGRPGKPELKPEFVVALEALIPNFSFSKEVPGLNEHRSSLGNTAVFYPALFLNSDMSYPEKRRYCSINLVPFLGMQDKGQIEEQARAVVSALSASELLPCLIVTEVREKVENDLELYEVNDAIRRPYQEALTNLKEVSYELEKEYIRRLVAKQVVEIDSSDLVKQYIVLTLVPDVLSGRPYAQPGARLPMGAMTQGSTFDAIEEFLVIRADRPLWSLEEIARYLEQERNFGSLSGPTEQLFSEIHQMDLIEQSLLEYYARTLDFLRACNAAADQMPADERQKLGSLSVSMRKPGETGEIGFCQNLVMDGTVQLGEAATEWVDTAVSEILKRISN